MSAEAPWLDAPVVDDPEPWKSAPIVEDPEQPWLSAPIVEDAPTETIPAGHPDRAEEVANVAANDKLREINLRYFREGPQSLNAEEAELRNKWAAGAGQEFLAGTMLDPQNAYIADPVLAARTGAENLAASDIERGRVNLKALDETLKHVNPFIQFVDDGSAREKLTPLEDLRHTPIIQAPNFADPTVAGGIANAALNTASGLTTPENLALLSGMGVAPKAVQQLSSLGFSGVMIKDAVEQLSTAAEGETAGEKSQRITQGVIGLLLGGLAGKHGIDGRPVGEAITAERAASLDAARERVNAGATRATPTEAQPVPGAAPAPLAEPDAVPPAAGEAPRPPADYEPVAQAMQEQWAQAQGKDYRARGEVNTPAGKATPDIEQRLRDAAQAIERETGFPDARIADVAERAGFTIENMGEAKGALMALANEGKVNFGGGDWSLGDPRSRAWSVIQGGDAAQYLRFNEAAAPDSSRPATPPEAVRPPTSEPARSLSSGEGSRAQAPESTGWRQQALPEELRTAPELEAALTGPDVAPESRAPMRELDTSKGGALFGGGGGKAVVAPKGSTPKGDTNFLRVESAPKRLLTKNLGLLTEGAADVIGKTKNKVGQLLSKQIRKHVDVEQELYGKLSSELDRATKGMSKGAVKKAIEELEPYLAAKENRRPLPAISKEAQSLLGAWENIAEQTGLISEAHNVQVFDPTTGGYRPMHRIGRAYVPRMFKPDVARVLSDPKSNPKLFNDLANALATHRNITPEAAATELRGVAGRFQSSDFMGNLEMARTGQLPELFYDYNLGNLTSRYLPAVTERLAQIIAYGQRLGPREAPSRQNLWDVAMKEAEDSYTQHYIRAAEDQATNLRSAAGPAKVAQQAQTVASGLLLSSPTTTVVRNLIGGMSATPELLGVRRSLGALFKTFDSQTKLDAKEMGVIRDNIGDFMHADQLGQSVADDVIRGATSKAFKWSGYDGSEGFVRSHAAATASQFAKDAVKSLAKDPASGSSKEALGLFKRMGVDAEKVVAENGDWKTGAETRKFIRTVIRDSQGGYRFDSVPLWANSTAGRLLYQFGRYGTQRSRNIWKNGIQPLLGEEVQWHGKTMVRRDAKPILKMGLGAILLGESFALISQGFFGRDRKDASVQEITQAFSEDEKEGLLLASERMINDMIMAGSFGIYGQPLDAARSLKDRSRFKNPAEPPAAASIKAVAGLAQKAIDQGGEVTNRDLISFLGSFAPGLKQLHDLQRNIRDEPLYEAENDVRTLRTSATRWAAANKLDVPKRAVGEIRKSANAPVYEPIQDALLVGDAARARFLADQFIGDEKDKTKARSALKASVKGRQPFRVGPFTSGEYREDFMKWASGHLPKQDFEQAKRVQDRYEAAARAAGLW